MDRQRVILITGATGILGKFVSQHLAMAGNYLALVGTHQGRLDEMMKDVNLPRENVMGILADLSQPDAAHKAHQEAFDRFGRVDILLHLVGGWNGGKPLVDVTSAELELMLSQHAWTTFYLLKAFLPNMRKQGWGRVIVVSSPVAGTPPPNDLSYAVAKAAQETMILTAAEELRYSGVTANILRVRTIDIHNARSSAAIAENAYWTTPEEITSAIDYLCSDAGGVVNGARLPLYGSP